jgi:FdhE protein
MSANDADPSTAPWLELLELVDQAAGDPAWRSAVPAPGGTGDGRPLLDGVTLALDARRLQRWASRLLDSAARNGGPAATLAGSAVRLDVGRLFGAAVTADAARVRTLARDVGIDADALAAVAALLPAPLLRACAAAWAAAVPTSWDGGHCPICGAWPTLAEARGLDRSRQLRCGGCGGDWKTAWLRCPFCGNSDHERLRVLAPAEAHEQRRVEACDACAGYIKTFTTLTARPAADVMRQDLGSIELDIAALERGYQRPERAAVSDLDVRVVLHERRAWGLLTRR